MKIIHVLNSVFPASGIACVVVDLACEQASLGHEVYVVSKGGAFDNLLEEHGVKTITVDQTRKPLIIIRALRDINKIISNIRPDIVHVHMTTGAVLCKFLKFFRSFNLISTVHNEFQKSAVLMGVADKIITVSNKVKESMIEKGVSGKKICVVKNGTIGGKRNKGIVIDAHVLARPSITTVAGMYKRKGISCLIKAFVLTKKAIPSSHLYLVGDGPDRSFFEEQAKKTDVCEDIHFEGFQKAPKKYLQQTDIFVLASTTETFGLALSEAREVGCAVVGSDVGGIPEVLEYGKAGQLFSSGNEKELAEILIKMLHNKNTLIQWQNRAKENLEWLTVRRMAEETIDVYTSLR